MTAIPQPGVSRGVPGPIHKSLRAVASRQWKLAASKGALHTLLVALAVLLGAALLLGFLPAVPNWLRIPVAAVTWAAALAVVAQVAALVFVGTQVLCLGAGLLSFRKVASLDPVMIFRG